MECRAHILTVLIDLTTFTFLDPNQLWALVPFIFRLSFVWFIKKTWAEKEVTSGIWHKSECGRVGLYPHWLCASPLSVFHLRSWAAAQFSAEAGVLPGIQAYLQESLQGTGLENTLSPGFGTCPVFSQMLPTNWSFSEFSLIRMDCSGLTESPIS